MSKEIHFKIREEEIEIKVNRKGIDLFIRTLEKLRATNKGSLMLSELSEDCTFENETKFPLDIKHIILLKSDGII